MLFSGAVGDENLELLCGEVEVEDLSPEDLGDVEDEIEDFERFPDSSVGFAREKIELKKPCFFGGDVFASVLLVGDDLG